MDLRDNKEDTAIYYAISNGKLKALELIVELGAKVDIKSKKGESPLSLAERHNQRRMISIIKNALAEKISSDGEEHKPEKKEKPKGKPGRKPSK